MNFWTTENLRKAMNGRWHERPSADAAAAELRGVTTDSRQAGPGLVFFARRGETTDGHLFLESAAANGSPLLVADDVLAVRNLPADIPAAVLLVDDTMAALGRLATAYRRTLRGRVIAVTGSVGKTTTKLLIDAVLSVRYRGTVSPRSYNNEVGVPLTILAADPADDYLVVEIGTNAPGEVAALARITEPDIAVITYIGSAHLEGLGGPAGVLREKASLLSHLREVGLAIVNGDFPSLLDYRRVAPNMVTFGRGDGCDLRMTNFAGDPQGTTFQVNGRVTYRLGLLGEHNAVNALAAIAVGRHMKLTEEQIASGLAAAAGAAMRMMVEHYGPPEHPLVVLNDCYNANPDSMAAALRVLRQYPTAGRRIAVLGDMGELGEAAPDLHRALGEQVVESQVDLAILIGRLSLFTAETISRHWPAERLHIINAWSEDVPRQVAGWVEPGDTVLVKASRAMGFERLLHAMARRFAASGGHAR